LEDSETAKYWTKGVDKAYEAEEQWFNTIEAERQERWK
jgi:hypothetical protein